MLFLVIEPSIVIDILSGVAKVLPEGSFVWIGAYGFDRERLTEVSHQLKGSIFAKPSSSIDYPSLDSFRQHNLVCKPVQTMMHGYGYIHLHSES